MEWNKYGKLIVGKREVEIKTLKLKDESGKVILLNHLRKDF